MGTGLIVAFVVTVWAAYFVPLALRRYDEAHNHSALEVLTPLSRVIRRAPARNTAEDFEYSGRGADSFAASSADADAQASPSPRLTRAAARLAARRRRRVLLTLLFANVVVGALVEFAIIPLWSVAIPAGLLVAWLVACRIQVRSEYGVSSAAKPQSRTGGARESRVRVPKLRMPRVRLGRLAGYAVEDEDTVTIIVSGQFEDVDPGRKHIMENAPLEADALDEQLVIAVPSAASHGELVWDPLPVTLPTYVTKPRAGRTVRTIDFDAPGVWTSGHVEGEEIELPLDSAEGSSSDDQRRAAGE
ncbi:MAG TPA: hypothetical protein VMZ66_04030 [Aeromicrobium sp.]|nr:hypothetical protein [Aeromicrobium sp.]